MEGLMMRKKRTVPSSMQKSSQPKIRIIHMIEPEIIKTDAANFREVVQRLTGKPTTEANTDKLPRLLHAAAAAAAAEEEGSCFSFRERVKMEEEFEEEIDIANTEEGGFLGSGFAEFDHFPAATIQMDPHPYEEPQLAN